MCSLVARAVPLTLVFLAACAPALGEDFDGYVERPTTCDLLNPRAADPHQHIPCGAGETCAPATADGSYSTTARTCIASMGSAHALAACEYMTDCAPGSTCDRVFGCLPYCRLSESGRP